MIAHAGNPQREEVAIERVQKLWDAFHARSTQLEEFECTRYNLGLPDFFLSSIGSLSVAARRRTLESALSIHIRLQMVSSFAK